MNMYQCYYATDKSIGSRYPQIQNFPPWEVNPSFPSSPVECEAESNTYGVKAVYGCQNTSVLSCVNLKSTILISSRLWAEGGLQHSLIDSNIPYCRILVEAASSLEYNWAQLPKVDLHSAADTDDTIVTYLRWDHPDLQCPEIPVGFLQMLPLKLKDINYGSSTGWLTRQSIRQIRLKDSYRLPFPIFYINSYLFCTEDFHNMFTSGAHTGLVFRKLFVEGDDVVGSIQQLSTNNLLL